MNSSSPSISIENTGTCDLVIKYFKDEQEIVSETVLPGKFSMEREGEVHYIKMPVNKEVPTFM